MTDRAERVALDGHLSIFNLPTFHDLTLADGRSRLQLDHYANDRLVGSLVGVVTGDEFASGFSAPFGGIDLVRETENLPRILEFLDDATGRLEGMGIRSIRIHGRPAIYARADIDTEFALLSRGFKIELTELNQHLDLSGVKSPEDYVERLGWRGRRDLRRASTQGLVFVECLDPEQRAEAYELLRANRVAKGRPMRLSLDYIERLRAQLPGRIRFFSLLAGDRACASAVVYLIKPGRWYVAYWGDAFHQLEQSPMNLLAFKVVERALAEGIVLIDLGISSAAGQLNPGLAQFKESVGAQSTLRFEFVRRVEGHG